MGNNTADIIIVGGGVMGCSAAYQLAKDGLHVVLLEQFTVGNHQGSSHGGSRLFRLAHPSKDYVELARAAYTLWREVESEWGDQLMQPADGLDIGTPAAMEGMSNTLQAAGVPFERLDRDEITRRFPHFALPEDTLGLYQDSYGMFKAGSCVVTMAALARQQGARIEEQQAVQHMRAMQGGVEVRTGQATYRAGGMILCAGSWMRPLARQLGLDLPLTVRNEVVTYFKPGDMEEWMLGRFPIFRQHLSGTDARWGVGFPVFGRPGVKVVLDCTGPIVQPEDPDRTPDPAVVGRIRAYAVKILPTLGTTLGSDLIETETCRYTLTPDEDFILDRHPEYPQVVVASPCSGHGFKFAPLIGRILADLAVRGETGYDIERFRLDRPGLREPAEGKNITKDSKDAKEITN